MRTLSVFIFFFVAVGINFQNEPRYLATEGKKKNGCRCGILLGDYNGTFIDTKGHSSYTL
jgi:hypothetical protein